MMSSKKIYKFFFIVIFCTANIFAKAQNVGIRTSRQQILIGEQLQYDLRITMPSPGYRINIGLPDTVPHFEVLQQTRLDTSHENGLFLLHQKIIFTSFDSGSWYIPSFPVTVEINNSYKKFSTDSVLINVGYSPADTMGLRDIKPVMEVTVTDYLWLYITIGILILLIVLFLVYYFIRKNRSVPLPLLDSKLSPYNEAMSELDKLSKFNLNLAEDVKQYHSQLAFIFKRYYSRVSHKIFWNQTTSELLLTIKQKQPDVPFLSSIAEALRMSDAVKFAKYIPPVSATTQSREIIKNAIGTLEKNKITNNNKPLDI